MNRCVVLGIMGLTILPLLHASNASEQQAAVKKLEDALSKTNIFELPSFQMKAMVEIDNQGNPLDGSYRLLWNDPEHWREEISFAGYNEIQVGDKEKVWIQRSTNFIPLRIYQLHAALGFGSSLGVDVGSAPGPLLTWISDRRTKSRNCARESGMVRSSLACRPKTNTNTHWKYV